MPIIIGTSVERFGHLMVKTEASPTYYFNLDYESAQTTPIGMKVRVRVSDRDYRDLLSGYIDHPRCEIEEVIGNAADPDVALAAICEAYQLPGDFPEEVIETLDEIPDALSDEKITDCLEHGYRDLRRLPTFTLDGRDAKDFDDAISLELLAGGKRRLWVHIADVAHYVEAYTPLDGEALHRGNSTYLPGQVIPMLPTKLSNGIGLVGAKLKTHFSLIGFFEGDRRLSLWSLPVGIIGFEDDVVCAKFREANVYEDAAVIAALD